MLCDCDLLRMDYPVSFQEVLRAIIEKRVERFGRAEVARRMGFKSMQQLDYVRRGFRGPPGKRVMNYITFEHLETLAKSEGVSLEDILREVYIATSALETIRRTDLERERALNEGQPVSRSDESEP
jgi:hypothetical protein